MSASERVASMTRRGKANGVIQRFRRTMAATLRRIAIRLDPPNDPYGEWDAKAGQLVIKLPDGGGRGLPLARVDISGMIRDERPMPGEVS